MSPRVASRALSAGFSPLYGKKKGASAPVGLAPAAGLVEWGATKIAGAIMDDNLLSPPTSAGWRHQSESAQEKAVPGAGRRRAGTASDEKHGRYSLRQRYAEGVYSSGTQISGACYSGMTPSGRLWMRRRSLFLCFAADLARRRR
jgi:hypothetical protein